MVSNSNATILRFAQPRNAAAAVAEANSPSATWRWAEGRSNVVALPEPRLHQDVAYGVEPESADAGILGDIWSAIAEHRVVMHYQPQYDFATGRIVAVEALVRLVAETGELVFPDGFIVQAEQSGLIVPLGRTVVELVCRDLSGWRRRGLPVDRVAINLSAHQLNVDAMLAPFVQQTLNHHGLNHRDLEFELTERQVLQADGIGARSLRHLEQAGARLALDDFGIGYSSVAYLTSLPIRTVKLDRSMVGRLPDDRRISRVIEHLVALARDLELEVVAEGIETQAQNDQLAAAGCHLGQGYLVARPLPSDQLVGLLSR